MAVDVNAVVMGYVECALWSSRDIDPMTGDEVSLDDYAGDLATEAMEVLEQDVRDFLDIPDVCEMCERVGMAAEQIGHDLWLTRNHHGAGFWDRGFGVVGDVLTRHAHAEGTRDLYIGDDGLVYVS